jgi:hypothetical protein
MRGFSDRFFQKRRLTFSIFDGRFRRLDSALKGIKLVQDTISSPDTWRKDELEQSNTFVVHAKRFTQIDDVKMAECHLLRFHVARDCDCFAGQIV